MNIGKNILYYLAAILIFVLFKLGYTVANNNELIFLLKPTDTFVGFILHSNSQYILESGYYHEKLNILIDKSCSGFNFWVLCFLMLTFTSLKFLNRRIYKILILPALLLFTYLLTIFVNTSRILFSIYFQNLQTVSTNKDFSWLHQAEGVFIYLSFLILIYLGFEYLL